MKKYTLLLAALLTGLLAYGQNRDYASYVDLLIGTGGHGHTHPAATLPNGMVQPGPDTRLHGWDACSGYYYADTTINGFAQTRLSGTGCGDLVDFLIMPTVGDQHVGHNGEKQGGQTMAYASRFSHANETAEPGYYSVYLDRYHVKAEMTATARTAFYRFTYPTTDRAGMVVDLDYNTQDQGVSQLEYEQVDSVTLRGSRHTSGWCFDVPTYFEAKFSTPFTLEAVRDTVRTADKTYPCLRLKLHFGKVTKDVPVLVKIAVSYVDGNGAHDNMAAELPGWNFDGTRRCARQLWNDVLQKIEIGSLGNAAADSTRQIFYTALYHAYIAPNLFSDADGRYLGLNGKIWQTSREEPIYTTFSLWDTHRALHPLLSIIDPAQNEAYIRTLIQKTEEGGVVPKWELSGNYTGCMIGVHFISLLADMHTKGYHHFNFQKAYRQSLAAMMADGSKFADNVPPHFRAAVMPKSRSLLEQYGYVPCDLTNESVAEGLEYAYNDWALSLLAKDAGDEPNAQKYAQLGKSYRHYFDASVGFMRGKDQNGQFRKDFDPTSSTHRNDDFCEGNSWQWTWFVPHDVEGLVECFGGKKKFTAKLDSLFRVSSEMAGADVSPDISGMVGQYAHGNEPGHHILHLYNQVGQPWKTQALVDSVLYSLYSAQPDGLSGNEDCGQMSAWYLLNAMGFYQPCPGKPIYSIGRPLFESVSIHQPNGKTFTVKTRNNSRQNKYIKSVRLNGTKLKQPFFTHAQLMEGGVLEIEMTSKPTRWGKK